LLSDKKKSNKILIGVTAAFILSALLPVTGLLKADMFQPVAKAKFTWILRHRSARL
jgi:hypothetical protein